MKTSFPNKADRKWYLVDAKGKTLGRLATVIASKLNGKDQVDYSPGIDNGAFVVVVNAEKFHVTGSKLQNKKYYRHSGYLGGLKTETLTDKLIKDPTFPIKAAVQGMLPKTRTRKFILKRLKLYTGSEHPHAGQNPETLTI